MARLAACRSLQSWRAGVSESARVDLSHPFASGLRFLWLAPSGFDSAVGPYGRLLGPVQWDAKSCGFSMSASDVNGGFSAQVAEGSILRLRLPFSIAWVGVINGVPEAYNTYAGGFHNLTDTSPWVTGGIGAEINGQWRVHGNSGGSMWSYASNFSQWEWDIQIPVVMWMRMQTSSLVAGFQHNTQVTQTLGASDPTYGSVGAFGIQVQEGASGNNLRASAAAVGVWDRPLTMEEFLDFRQWFSTMTVE